MIQIEFAEEILLKYTSWRFANGKYKCFIISLKVTWLRRLIIPPDNDNWSNLSKSYFNKIVSMGDVYSGQVIKDLLSILEKHFEKLESVYKIF